MQRFCICPHKKKKSRYGHRWYKSDTACASCQIGFIANFSCHGFSLWAGRVVHHQGSTDVLFAILMFPKNLSNIEEHILFYTKSYVLCEPHWPSSQRASLLGFSLALRQTAGPCSNQSTNQSTNLNPLTSTQPSTLNRPTGGPSMPNRRQQSSHHKWDHPRSQLLRLSQTSLVESRLRWFPTNPDVFVATTADSLDVFGADFFSVFRKKRPFKYICHPLGHLLFVQSHFC